MHLKNLSLLSLSTLALASPIAQDATPSDIVLTIPRVPTSIMTVLETAIPASWYEEVLNPSSRASIISEIEAGTLPAWYNSLPASVKAWATSAGGAFAQEIIGATPTPTATGADNGNDSTHAVTATPAATAMTSGAKGQTTKMTSDSSSETPASTAKSSSPSSSTSTGGAPIATAGVAMSFAGAAGLLGLALAL